FDEVVARNPSYDRAEDLASGYSEYARHSGTKPADAEVALLRAIRFSKDEKERARLESQRLTLNAKQNLERGLADTVPLERALELDPNNQSAKALLSELRRAEHDQSSERSRQLAAGSISLAALVAIVALLRRRREDANVSGDGASSS